jgi:hypothetical protein
VQRAAEQGLAVLEEAEKVNPKAIEAMDELDRNEVSVAEAYREVFFVRSLNAVQNKGVMRKVTPALSYFCTALWRFARILAIRAEVESVSYGSHSTPFRSSVT